MTTVFTLDSKALGLALSLGLTLTVIAGCGGRSVAPGDGGDADTAADGIAGTDGGGQDGGGGDCSGLARVACDREPSCQWDPGCPACDGPGPEGRCIAADAQVSPCPAIACLSCAELDEATCQQTPGCRNDYCPSCSCEQSYLGCRNDSSPAPDCPALGCPQPLCHCTGLDEQTCRATAGCTTGDCPDCNGNSTFFGCYTVDDLPGCPPIACDDGCRDDGDCADQNALCAPPGTAVPCGICKRPETSCVTDTECQAVDPTTICAVNTIACGCEPECIPGCQADSECPEGEACVDLRCERASCDGGRDCPGNFECSSSGGSGQHCDRLQCEADNDCDAGGFCVDGQCYAQLGFCQLPVP